MGCKLIFQSSTWRSSASIHSAITTKHSKTNDYLQLTSPSDSVNCILLAHNLFRCPSTICLLGMPVQAVAVQGRKKNELGWSYSNPQTYLNIKLKAQGLTSLISHYWFEMNPSVFHLLEVGYFCKWTGNIVFKSM